MVVEKQAFDPKIIKVVIFDIDGTLYVKDASYCAANGSIQTAQDFFRFNAYLLLSQGKSPDEVSGRVVREYLDHIAQKNLVQVVDAISPELKEKYLSLVDTYGSNGKVFLHECKTESTFLHSLLKHIDFSSILSSDKKLQQVFSYLKTTGKQLGILTTEVFDTVQSVSESLGFDLKDFKMATGDEFGILCAENVKEKKPSLEGFNKIKEIYSSVDPRSIVYVGDHFEKDVHAAIKAGLQAIHIDSTSDIDVSFGVVTLDDCEVEYAVINSIYQLEELL